jgi:hypothetical protein
MNASRVICCVLVLAATQLSAQEEKSNAAQTLGQCQWLVGHWQGSSGTGMEYEETWGSASAGTMLGMFRLSSGGKPVLFEILKLSVEDDKVTFAMRHFSADLTPREDETIKMTAVKLTDNELVLVNPKGNRPKRLTYRRAKDTLTAVVETVRNGETTEFKLTLNKTDLSGKD